MSFVRKAASVHSAGGGRMQVSAMRPLGSAAVGGFNTGRMSSVSSGYSFGGGGAGFGSSFSAGGGGGGGGFGSSFSAGGGGGGGGFGAGFASSLSAGGGDDIFLSSNEKVTMQNLNDRLAVYLEKVRGLEEENKKLEIKITEWCSQVIPGSGDPAARDYSHLEKEIEDLTNKVYNCRVDTATILLNIDNAKLAADDFRNKYETEQSLRMGVEADINGLKRVLDELGLGKADADMQIESIRDELDYLKKSHEEDMKSVSGDIAGQVNVELDAAPGTNLMDAMDACRRDYEGMIDQIRRDAEKWYNEKAKDLTAKAGETRETLTSHKSEISDLKRSLQSLEIELQTLMAKKASLEATLENTEGQYGMKIQEIQMKINVLEDQLADLRAQTEFQKQEYQMLLDVKQRLEGEIKTYRSLLEGEESKVQHHKS